MEHDNTRNLSVTAMIAISLCAGLAGGLWGGAGLSFLRGRERATAKRPGCPCSAPMAAAPRLAPPPAPVLSMPPPAAPVECPADVTRAVRRTGDAAYEIDRAALDRLLDQPPALATGARFVPALRDGKPDGLRVYAVRPCSLFARLGLQSADRIQSIDGQDVSTPDRALAAYQRLRQASDLTLRLERRGQEIALRYQIR